MKVILNNDVANLGEEGDVKEVARGYARNFLIPKNLALPYNKQTLALFESRRAQIEKRKQEKLNLALGLKQRIEAESLSLTMPAGEQGKLFGSVTSNTVADALEKLGIAVERRKIEIPDHTIKSAGSYKVRIRLYGNEEAVLRVSVNQTPGEQKTEPAREGAPAPASASEPVPTTAGKSEETEPESEETPSEE